MRAMLPLSSSCVLLLSASLLTAQSASPAPAPAAQAPGATAPAAGELAAAKTRATAALQKSAALADTAFALKWGPDKKKKDDGNPLAAMLGRNSSGATTGSWHEDRQRVVFDNDNDDELLLIGRRTLARDGTTEWRLRNGRFADGNQATWVPDVPLLLQQLAAMDLAVAHRAPGALDDKPVEVITATLTPEQTAQLVWAGALPDAVVSADSSGRIVRMAMMAGGAGAAGGARPPAPVPTATVDVALHVDPGTNLVHKLHFRSWVKADAAGMPGVVMVAGGAGRVAVGGGGDEDDAEEDEAKADAEAAAPLAYENGLPKRSRKKISVNDVVVTLREHGKTAAAPLTDEQKKLLGR
jgi:hypothetical protein